MEDAEIVDLFFQRLEQAIPETAAKYQGLIFQISRNILENPQDAEECVNDTYLGLWNAIPPHRPNPLLAFVCRVARNVSLNRYRHNHAQRRDESRNLPLVELEGCLAGGSFATTAWERFAHPVAVEHVRAKAGMDIGGTLIGMHLREVAVPVRLSVTQIGQAPILCARTRPKFIGGERAQYCDFLK